MSLSWRDRLYVVLAPARVDVMRVAGLARRSAEHTELEPAGSGAPAWRGAVQALTAALPRLAARGGRCHVVLSNHFCRYALVPGNAGLADAQEMEAYARLRLDEIYGAQASAPWEVRLGRAPAGEARLACAVDRELLSTLREASAAAKLRLASVRPLLGASFDHSRRRFAATRFWFAAAEEGRLCLGAIDNRCWRSIASQRISGDVGAELQAMLGRAMITVPGMRTDSVYLYSRDPVSDAARELPGVTVLPLPPARGALARVFA